MVIAIIDSGISEAFEHFNIIGGISFFYAANNEIECNADLRDMNGHGTMICKVISSINPNVSFYIVKILDKNNRASSELLLHALDYLISCKMDIDIILMSLATIDNAYIEKMNSLINELYSKGVILIASAHNKYDVSYPAVLENVIGVKGARLYTNKIYYNKSASIECIADSSLVYCNYNTKNSIFKTFGGTSKAAAIVAACISQLEKSNLTIENREITLNLKFGAVNYETFLMKNNLSEKGEKNLCTYNYIGNDKRNYELIKLINTFCTGLSKTQISERPLWHLIDSLETMNIILINAANMFEIDSRSVVYTGSDLYSVNNLCNKLYIMEENK